ncbi:MAG TPA: hypothetical protein VJC03_03060, partial [bacterium]|nr:hypothetical protein [bacterium]
MKNNIKGSLFALGAAFFLLPAVLFSDPENLPAGKVILENMQSAVFEKIAGYFIGDKNVYENISSFRSRLLIHHKGALDIDLSYRKPDRLRVEVSSRKYGESLIIRNGNELLFYNKAQKSLFKVSLTFLKETYRMFKKMSPLFEPELLGLEKERKRECYRLELKNAGTGTRFHILVDAGKWLPAKIVIFDGDAEKETIIFKYDSDWNLREITEERKGAKKIKYLISYSGSQPQKIRVRGAETSKDAGILFIYDGERRLTGINAG